MTPPVTGISLVLAVAAVLYTYQSKHEADLIERDIKKIVRETQELRDKTRVLNTEWTLRGNPERLGPYVKQYLTLKPLDPGQFTSFAELTGRLPAPRAMAPAPVGGTDTTDEPETQPIGGRLPAADSADSDTDTAEQLPIPPLPVPPPPVTIALASPAPAPAAPSPVAVPLAKAPPPPAVIAPPPKPMMAAAEPRPAPRPIELRPVEPKITEARAPEARAPEPRPAAPRPMQPAAAPPIQASMQPPIQAQMQPMPVRTPPPVQMQAAPRPAYAAQPNYGGSMLGMAHAGGGVPAPSPMPVSTAAWSNGN